MTPPPSTSHTPRTPNQRHRAEAGSDWRKRVWKIWGVLALVWFLGSTVYYAFGAGGSMTGTSRPAPLLSGIECNRIVSVEGQRACRGVADLSRERRIMMQDRQAERAVRTGSAILGPPLLSLIALALFMRYVYPPQPRSRPSVPGRR